MRRTTGFVCALLLLVGCGGEDDPKTDEPEPSPTSAEATEPSQPSVEPDARYGTVEQLRDAAIAAGYVCKRWKNENNVDLAAESGSCSGADVFSTFASAGDLQSQLDSYKGTDDMLADAGIEPDPHLVGSNWIITGPAVAPLQSTLGGTVVTP